MSWYVYMVRCRDNSLYTGCAVDVSRRVQVHNAGKGAKYTRSRLPVELVWQEPCADRAEALRREYAVKQLTHAQKEALLESENK